MKKSPLFYGITTFIILIILVAIAFGACLTLAEGEGGMGCLILLPYVSISSLLVAVIIFFIGWIFRKKVPPSTPLSSGLKLGLLLIVILYSANFMTYNPIWGGTFKKAFLGSVSQIFVPAYTIMYLGLLVVGIIISFLYHHYKK